MAQGCRKCVDRDGLPLETTSALSPESRFDKDPVWPHTGGALRCKAYRVTSPAAERRWLSVGRSPR